MSTKEIASKMTQKDWESIMGSPDFKKLVSAKNSFIWPVFIFSVIFYFLLPISVGYFKPIMNQKILGPINLAYFFALSQFFVAWFIAWLYAKVASSKFDPLARKIVNDRRGNN